jgi:hypothetical protein
MMRKAAIFLTAGLLVLWSGTVAGAQAQDKPTSAPGSEPGTIEPVPPDRAYTVDVEKVTLRVDGKVVEAAPPGVEVDLTITLHNFSKETIRHVKATLERSSVYRVVDAESAYGNIAPDGRADGSFAIVIPKDGCPDFLGIGGEVTFDGGTSGLKVGVPTACPGPRLYVDHVVFEGGDGDGVPEPGETLRAFVVLRNDGRDPAANVRSTIKVSGEGVSTATDTLRWADIAVGKTARSLDAITVKISDDAPRQDACPPMARDDGGVATTEVPPSDTPVSSDGSAPPGGNVSSGPASTAPGYAGGGSSGSTGTEPSQTEPAPPVTGTVVPEPAPAPDETDKSEPAPEPGTPEPAPDQDRPVLVAMHLSITATDYSGEQDYSTGVFCALAEGVAPIPAKGAPDGALRARDTAATSPSGAAPAIVLILLAAVATGVRRVRLG